LSESPRNVVSLVRPLHVELRGLKATLESHFEERERTYIFESVWAYLLYTEAIRAVVAHADGRPHVWESSEIARITEWKREHEADLDGELDERLSYALERAARGVDATTHWTPNGAKVERFYRQRASALERSLPDLIADRVAYLLIDNLDQDWDPDDPTSARLLVGLVAAAQKIMTPPPERPLRILIFLREDIQRAVRAYDDDYEKRPWMDLKWDRKALLALIAERIRHSLQPHTYMSQEQLWDLCFDTTVDGMRSDEYILDRTLLRPRHAIWYCNRALDIARHAAHAKILSEDVIGAERDYSGQVLTNLDLEFSHPPMSLEGIAIHFIDAPDQLDRESVHGRVRQWLADTAEPNVELRQALNEAEVVAFLYEVGFLGTVGPTGQCYYRYDEPDYRRALARAKVVSPAEQVAPPRGLGRILRRIPPRRQSSVPLYCIHPAFWRTLGVSS